MLIKFKVHPSGAVNAPLIVMLLDALKVTFAFEAKVICKHSINHVLFIQNHPTSMRVSLKCSENFERLLRR